MNPAAILPVADMQESIAFYETIGLEIEPYDATYAFVVGDGTMLCHLRLIDQLDVSSNHSALYVHVGDVDGVHERMATSGVAVSAVEDMPWGMREFWLTDPSGNLIRIGRSTDADHDHPHDHDHRH